MSAPKPSSIHVLAVLISALYACSLFATGELSCRDEDGRPVDWYIAYKFPKIDTDGNFRVGHAYAYITSEDVADSDAPASPGVTDPKSIIFIDQFQELLMKFGGGFNPRPAQTKVKRKKAPKFANQGPRSQWAASQRLISDPKSVIMQTLAPAYDPAQASLNSIFYNDSPVRVDFGSESDDEDDSPPQSPSRSPPRKKKINLRVAHAKGVVLMDEKSNQGVWLTHSVPKFPAHRNSSLEYPETGRKNGQTFMCINFDVSQTASHIISHLVNMRPYVYDRVLRPSLIKRFPELQSLDLYENLKGKRTNPLPKLFQTVVTRDGQVMKLFSKSNAFEEDIYANWIAEQIDSDLYVATWRLGSGGPLSSTCPEKEHHINNILELKYNERIFWVDTKDHSKWVISDSEDVGVVCISDSNRMESQFKRGAGAVCFRCQTCWHVFSNTIRETEPCPAGKRMNRKQSDQFDGLLEKIKQELHL